MKIKQTSLEQTGVALYEDNNGELTQIPLFSLNPVDEAHEMESLVSSDSSLKHVFISNNLLDYKIEDAIEDFQEKNGDVLPQNLIEELVAGFPFLCGFNETSNLFLYA